MLRKNLAGALIASLAVATLVLVAASAGAEGVIIGLAMLLATSLFSASRR